MPAALPSSRPFYRPPSPSPPELLTPVQALAALPALLALLGAAYALDLLPLELVLLFRALGRRLLPGSPTTTAPRRMGLWRWLFGSRADDGQAGDDEGPSAFQLEQLRARRADVERCPSPPSLLCSSPSSSSSLPHPRPSSPDQTSASSRARQHQARPSSRVSTRASSTCQARFAS